MGCKSSSEVVDISLVVRLVIFEDPTIELKALRKPSTSILVTIPKETSLVIEVAKRETQKSFVSSSRFSVSVTKYSAKILESAGMSPRVCSVSE